jgi:hypothetical protein
VLVIHLVALKLPDSTMKPRTLHRVGLAWCGAAQVTLVSTHLLLLPALGPLVLSLSGSGYSPSAIEMSREDLDLAHHGQASQTELDLVLPGSMPSPTLPVLPHLLPLAILHASLVDLRSHWQQSYLPSRLPLLLAMLLSSAC